jgi:hypothetical protein
MYLRDDLWISIEYRVLLGLEPFTEPAGRRLLNGSMHQGNGERSLKD